MGGNEGIILKAQRHKGAKVFVPPLKSLSRPQDGRVRGGF